MLSACDWVDSTGVQESAPLLQLEEGRVVPLTEGQARTLDPVETLDPDRDVVSWRWNDAPVQAGALPACAAVQDFRSQLAAGSVAEACVRTNACELFFEPQVADDDGRFLFRLIPPQLKAPVGVVYQLTGIKQDGAETRANFTFCLIAVNEPPVAANDVFTVEVGSTLTVDTNGANVLSNDSDDIDVGNVPLFVETPALREPSFATAFNLRSDGGFTYTPDPSLEFTAGGRRADSFDYRISDGVNTSSATVVINIVAQDKPPVLTDTEPVIDALVGIEQSVSLSDFFVDPEGAELGFAVVSGLPDSGNFSLTPAGDIQGIAEVEDIGTWPVLVTASDAISSVDALVTLTVEENLPPVAESGIPDQTLDLGDRFSFSIARFFEDPEGESLTYAVNGSGAAINIRTGLITASFDQPGTYTISVAADDGVNPPTVATFDVVVLGAVNRRPVYRGFIVNQSVPLGTAITVIQGDFSDPDDDLLTFTILGNLPDGLELDSSGVITGTPTEVGSSGALRIQATDPGGLFVNSDIFRITVTTAPVGNVNQRPTFEGVISDVTVLVDQDITPIAGTFSDPDEDELTYTVTGNLPDGLEIDDETGRITGEPDDEGVYSGLRIVATDPDDLSAISNLFSITVIEETIDDDAQFIEVDGVISFEAESFESTLTAVDHSWIPVTDSDASGTVAMQALPDSGLRRSSIANSPRLNFRVRFEEAGTYYLWFRGLGVSNGDSVHIGINGRAAQSGINLTLPFDWGWSNENGSSAAIIDVPDSGVQTISVWMREDGVSIDKLLLTQDEDFEPTAEGPPETLNPAR
ncbi:MAG: putative Ig domain-containing protein [Gammaproteobacteria bacterium]|nr:putative Ig domain-containing protein [Gammaproteobacteria bacterium]